MRVDKGRIIDDIIEPNRNQYIIPVYQRNYDWTREQCEKLFFDILKCSDQRKTHFVGSIVNAEIETRNKIHRYVIVDGQQRITTIFLLLKALFDSPEATDSDKSRINEWLFNIDKHNELSLDDSNKLKLKPIKSDDVQLMLLVNNKYDEMEKSSNIWCNYEIFKSLIAKELEKGHFIKDIYKGLEQLVCAIITLQEDDNAQEVFESINSTGLPLTISDLIRNYVLMTDANQEYLFETYWIKIESLIGKENMSSFIIDYLNYKADGWVKESTAYECFKEYFEKKKHTNESALKELLHYANIFNIFSNGSLEFSTNTNAFLSGLKQIKQTTAYVFLFQVFDDYYDKIIDQKELEKVLRFLLNYSIRRLICEVGSNSLRGLYKTLYARVFVKEEYKSTYYDSIISFFKQLNTKDKLVKDSDFEEALIKNDLYRKSHACKYILATIENGANKEKIDIRNMSIEHIMPQNSDLPTAWRKMLGENWKEIQNKYLHVLGNLTLTGYNSELSDKPFADKLEYLKKSKANELNSDVINTDIWTEQQIVDRGIRLAKLVCNIFDFEEPTKFIEYVDNNYKIYALNDNPSWKRPNYFVLLGEQHEVDSFIDMLIDVVGILYDRNPEILTRIAKNEEHIIPWSKQIIFSYNQDIGGPVFRHEKSGINMRVRYNAQMIIYILGAILDEYGIDLEDFAYSARSVEP